MVLRLDGNSELGTNVRSDLGYFICLRHLFRSRAVQVGKKSDPISFHSYLVICSKIPSHISTMGLISNER